MKAFLAGVLIVPAVSMWLLKPLILKMYQKYTLSGDSDVKPSSATQGQIVGAREKLSLAPTISPWVSEDDVKHNQQPKVTFSLP